MSRDPNVYLKNRVTKIEESIHNLRMEILSAIAIVLVETIIPLVVEIIFGLLVEVLPYIPGTNRKSVRRPLQLFVVLLIGGLCGWASSMIMPSLLLQDSTLQILNLLISPILAGFLANKLAEALLSRKRDRVRFGSFWVYFWFTLGFLAMRTGVFHASFS